MSEENNLPSTSKDADEELYESDGSVDSSEVEKCPICLLAFTTDKEIGKPAVCDHIFCFPCIHEWSKVTSTCPIDRKEFKEIRVFGDLECEHQLRTVKAEEKAELKELIVVEEFTQCEVCNRTDYEDRMLLCDGCDKGWHMDCLDPPLLEVPQGDWYCDECFETDSEESEDDTNELEDLNNDIEDEFGELPDSRLRMRQQPQILRTMQSERIRNAILARMSLRSTREALGQGPSTSAAAAPAPKRAYKRRRTGRKTKKRRTVVVEYDVRDGSDKFAMKTRKVARRKTRKRRKKAVRAARRRKPIASTSAVAGASSFKSSNANVYELQRGRIAAGVSGFNIFEPTNLLDYVPDEEDNIGDSGIDEFGEGSGGLLTQAIISLNNPRRRNLLIKNRVLQNCTTTSSAPNLLDSIMQDQSMFAPGSISKKFAVDKTNGKLVFVGKKADECAKKASGGDDRSPGSEPQRNEPTPSTSTAVATFTNDHQPSYSTNSAELGNSAASDGDLPNTQIELNASNINDSPPDKKKKPKKPAFDMFDESSNPEPSDDCPNFSIYDSVEADQDASSSFQMRPNVYDEENVDLVQLSDNEVPAEEALSAIVASQPASPDLENDGEVEETMPERSYTPPLIAKTSDDGPDKDERDRKKKEKEKEKEAKRDRKRELERYNVRDRLKERSPAKLKDKFGRNRSRSRSSPRRKRSRRRSPSPPRERRRRSPERHRRSHSRSRSRRRTPSIDYDRKKKIHKEKVPKPSRRSRSFTPKHHRPTTPDRRGRSKSKKAKRKKHRDYSKEKPSTLTKEVFTSGQNILVSVNFNNQEEKSAPKQPKIHDREEPKDIVDITARKKITISSKPVAIIDLARSPFRELTPEYKSNVIELSDSEGEKSGDKKQAKSPDSTLSSKLYDPFDILNSPSNENVTSSQNAAAQSASTKQQKASEPVKANMTYNKNIMAMATNSLFFNEENLVSSSSSLLANEKLQNAISLLLKQPEEHPSDKNATKHDIVPMDIVESPYSPGHEYDDSFPNDDGGNSPKSKQSKNKGINIFDVLFGSTTPPGLDRLKSKKSGDKSTDHSTKYLNKLKRQERVIEEVKLVIKPYYSKRTITKEQYKEILRKAVPKICHSKEINPQKIKILIDSYVKIFKHKKKRSGSAPDEIF